MAPGLRLRAVVRLQKIGFALLFAHSAAADDWPYYQHDASHTGNSTAVVDPQALSLAWTAPGSPTGYSTPVIIGNRIYAMQNQQGNGNSQTTVSSFDLATGAIIWSYTANVVFPSQPGVGGGFVTFVGQTIFTSPSLYVLDATTGALRYTVPIPQELTWRMPTVVQDPISGDVTAFVAGGSRMIAVSLGPAGGSVLWAQTGSFAQSIPSVVGSSVVIAGTDRHYAFDRATGAVNNSWSEITGNHPCTAAYDASRHQFYVLEGITAKVSAYRYSNNANITLLWQRTGAGVGDGGSVAIGPSGKV